MLQIPLKILFAPGTIQYYESRLNAPLSELWTPVEAAISNAFIKVPVEQLKKKDTGKNIVLAYNRFQSGETVMQLPGLNPVKEVH